MWRRRVTAARVCYCECRTTRLLRRHLLHRHPLALRVATGASAIRVVAVQVARDARPSPRATRLGRREPLSTRWMSSATRRGPTRMPTRGHAGAFGVAPPPPKRLKAAAAFSSRGSIPGKIHAWYEEQGRGALRVRRFRVGSAAPSERGLRASEPVHRSRTKPRVQRITSARRVRAGRHREDSAAQRRSLPHVRDAAGARRRPSRPAHSRQALVPRGLGGFQRQLFDKMRDGTGCWRAKARRCRTKVRARLDCQK
jgi:hypothetical protein